MDEWLSESWLEAVSALTATLPPVAEASGLVDLAISTAPRREVHLHWSYESGQPMGGSPGAASDPDLALTMTADDAAGIFGGQVEPSVAFMRGRLKATGDGALLLGWLQSTTDPVFAEWCEKVRAVGWPEG